jgi:hypothetical protein
VAASHQRTPAGRPVPLAADTRRLRQCPAVDTPRLDTSRSFASLGHRVLRRRPGRPHRARKQPAADNTADDRSPRQCGGHQPSGHRPPRFRKQQRTADAAQRPSPQPTEHPAAGVDPTARPLDRPVPGLPRGQNFGYVSTHGCDPAAWPTSPGSTAGAWSRPPHTSRTRGPCGRCAACTPDGWTSVGSAPTYHPRRSPRSKPAPTANVTALPCAMQAVEARNER